MDGARNDFSSEPEPAGSDRPIAPGKRERNKLEKRARILGAARAVFREKGFTAATIQEIAAQAQVANGTVHLYARSKEDLLLQVFAGDIDQVLDEAKASLPCEGSTLVQLLHVFGAIADYHQELGAPLSAVLVRELMHAPEDIRAVPGTIFIKSAVMMTGIIENGRRRGELRSGVDAREAADMIFSIFHWQISQWALGRLSFAAFKAQLRSRIALAMMGVETPPPRPGPGEPG